MLIHPFREGNGRKARILAMLMGLQAGLPALCFDKLSGRNREQYFPAVPPRAYLRNVPWPFGYCAVRRDGHQLPELFVMS